MSEFDSLFPMSYDQCEQAIKSLCPDSPERCAALEELYDSAEYLVPRGNRRTRIEMPVQTPKISKLTATNNAKILAMVARIRFNAPKRR